MRPVSRLRHFPRESLIARLSSGEASIVKVELAGGRASLTLTTRSEPHNRRVIHAEPEVNPARMRTGHGLNADIRGAGTVTDMDWLRSRTDCGHGQDAVADCFGLDTAAASGSDNGAAKLRPVCGRRILRRRRSKACTRQKPSGEGDKRRQMHNVKRRHMAANSLPPFVAF